jgi:hypothetical protein
VAVLRRADPPSKDSYRLCIGLRNWRRSQGPTKGCRAIERGSCRRWEDNIEIDAWKIGCEVGRRWIRIRKNINYVQPLGFTIRGLVSIDRFQPVTLTFLDILFYLIINLVLCGGSIPLSAKLYCNKPELSASQVMFPVISSERRFDHLVFLAHRVPWLVVLLVVSFCSTQLSTNYHDKRVHTSSAHPTCTDRFGPYISRLILF